MLTAEKTRKRSPSSLHCLRRCWCRLTTPPTGCPGPHPAGTSNLLLPWLQTPVSSALTGTALQAVSRNAHLRTCCSGTTRLPVIYCNRHYLVRNDLLGLSSSNARIDRYDDVCAVYTRCAQHNGQYNRDSARLHRRGLAYQELANTHIHWHK